MGGGVNRINRYLHTQSNSMLLQRCIRQPVHLKRCIAPEHYRDKIPERGIIMTHTNYNDFGEMVVESRPYAGSQITLDDSGMTRAEWQKYLGIMDEVVATCYNYMAFPGENLFPAFRNSLHRLYTFFGIDTRILSIDSYAIRLTVAAVTMRTMKSDALKKAEKERNAFDSAMKWAMEINGVTLSDDSAVLFPNGMESHYNSEIQDKYNLIIKHWTAQHKENLALTVAVLKSHLATLNKAVSDIEALPWQKYRTIKCDLPLDKTTGRAVIGKKHASAQTRKNIEDNIADMLTQRSLMTPEQLEKEHKQIKGGRK